jgi:hypothetical protein
MWIIQNEEEIDFLRSSDSVLRIAPYTFPIPIDRKTSPHTSSIINNIEKQKEEILLKKCWGKIHNRDEFLTIFDTCNSFVCDINDKKVITLSKAVYNLAKEPMKSSVWAPRGEHHVRLLIDGIVKTRCLFEDYDSTFEPKQKDYDIAEKILIDMVKGWDSVLTLKKDTT